MNDQGPDQPLLHDIADPRVRQAFTKIDRARFVPDELQTQAWADHPLPIEDGATISQPSLVAKMTEWLDVGSGHRVLEIGTGSGYQTAILAELASEVHTVEYSRELSKNAEQRLKNLGYANIQFLQADGAGGWPGHAPYDRILATVAFPAKPTQLLDQLSPDGGIALVPVGPPGETQYLTRYQRNDSQISADTRLPVRFLSLR
jgi:protein-L-isoaspartate(D-aspartate) O-methyltransferase